MTAPTSRRRGTNREPDAGVESTRDRAPSALPDPREPLPIEPFEPLIARFFSVAEAHAADPAVVLGTVAWPYQRLAATARSLAADLEGLGVQPGDPVAVTGAKSPGLVAGVLAVLARGGILVPIDPQLPALRRREMLERSGARLVLEAGEAGVAGDGGGGPRDGAPSRDGGSAGGGGRAGTLHPSGLQVRRYAIPADPQLAPAEDERGRTYRLPDIGGDDPAYLLFTSGTTGIPKGIVGRQRGLSHFLNWERTITGIGPGDRTGQLTGLSFDVVLRDLFLPLTSGAALHLPPFVPGTTAPSELLEFLARDRITLIHAVPTIASFWLSDVPETLQLPDLRWVLFAGEPLPGALVRRWRERFGTPRIGNLYGPTETTLAKCFAEIGPEPESGVQPVGHALPGAQALVMDGDRLCGPEELGEIVIRTPYRSLGYLGAEGNPRPPFVPSPFTRDPDDLVYRTGDRGRYRVDGVLEIHGRLDDQVKILGVRIEPSEVAAELATHPAVRACTVVAVPDAQGEPALVAYVVPERGEVPGQIPERELRAYLADRLIAAKVPRLFVPVPELPRTPNGKVDRRALPPPPWNVGASVTGGEDAPTATSPAVPAASPAPGAADPAAAGRGAADPAAIELVASTFRELLGQPRVGPDDDFFRLGGHSLLAARLVQRLEARTGTRIRMQDLFQHSTPRALAALLPGAASTAPTSEPATDIAAAEGPPDRHTASVPMVDGALPESVVPVRTSGRRRPVFVIAGVGSRILFLRHLSAYLGEDQPLYALHTRFLDDGSTYERVEDLAGRYARDLRAVQPAGPYRLLGFSYGGLVAFELAQQLRADGAEVEFLGIVDTRLPGLRQHGPWSILRSIPRRLLNLAAILQPLSGAERRTYLRLRLLIARQNTWAHILEWLTANAPRRLRERLPPHPYGSDEIEWLAADTMASRRYAPRPYPGRIAYFWALHSQRPPSVFDHREGWQELAVGGLDVEPIPGSHLTIMAEPLVRSTARAIRTALRAVDAGRSQADDAA